MTAQCCRNAPLRACWLDCLQEWLNERWGGVHPHCFAVLTFLLPSSAAPQAAMSVLACSSCYHSICYNDCVSTQGFNTRRISKPDDGNRLPQAPPMTAQQKLARQQTCMPLFIPAAVTPVVERFLQVRHTCYGSSLTSAYDAGNLHSHVH